jgi:glycosyltransferase involved in cell wall biosynthesis
MRILVVSSYPPRHCGIGAYAAGQAERLRAEGHDVTVVSPPDGLGDIRVPFGDGRQFREAARRGRDFDRIVVHFQPGIYYRPGARATLSKIRTSLDLLLLVHRRPQTEILVHEAHRPRWWHPSHILLRWAFIRAPLLFHTDVERESLERDYRIRVRARVVDHREGVLARNPLTREAARRLLGLPMTEALFLCAGFLHPRKAYERAIRAFEDAGAPGHLVIVGSVRDPTEENLTYAAALRTLAERTPGVRLVEEFLSEEELNAWVAAADRLVVPYTRAWSSGVLARARVLGTPALVSAVGGLAEQAGPDDEVFHSDDDLRRMFGGLGPISRGPDEGSRPFDGPSPSN